MIILRILQQATFDVVALISKCEKYYHPVAPPLLNLAFCLPLSVHISHSICAVMKGFTVHVCIYQIPCIPAIVWFFGHALYFFLPEVYV